MLRTISVPRRAVIALGNIALTALAIAAHAEPSLQTRVPSERKELDRDNNGAADAYREQYALSKNLEVTTYEAFEKNSRAVKGRVTSILFQGKEIWSEVYVPSLRERTATVARNSPFEVAMASYPKSDEATVALLDERNSLIAVLIREKDGRFFPLTDGELARLRKLGQGIAEFGQGVFEHADGLKDSKDKSTKLMRKLDQAVSEYSKGVKDSAEGPNESKGKSKETK